MPADKGNALPPASNGTEAELQATAALAEAPADAPTQPYGDGAHVSPQTAKRQRDDSLSPRRDARGSSSAKGADADANGRHRKLNDGDDEPVPKRSKVDKDSNGRDDGYDDRMPRSPEPRSPRNVDSRHGRSRSRDRSRSWSRSPSRSPSRSLSRSRSRSRSRNKSRSRSRSRSWSRSRHRRHARSPERSRGNRGSVQERRGGHDDREPTPPYKRRRSSVGSGIPESGPRDVRRKASVSQEERKRGQRLFGGLLSTLSQTATARARTASGPGGQRGGRGLGGPGGPRTGAQPGSRPADVREKQDGLERRRLEDAERRQEAQKQTEEDRKRHAERVAKLDRVRKIEQVRFDEQKLHTVQANELTLAHNLQTKSKPVLYYRPWELTKEQERIIGDQVQATKRRISQQRRDFEKEKQERLAALGVRYIAKEILAEPVDEPEEVYQEREKPEGDADTAPSRRESDAMVDEPNAQVHVDAKSPLQPQAEEGGQQHPAEHDEHKREHGHGHGHHDRHDHHDHHDERDKDIMVETEEDTVIY